MTRCLAPSLAILLLGGGCDESAQPNRAVTSSGRTSAPVGAGTGDPVLVEGNLRLEADQLFIGEVTQCGEPSVHSVRLHNIGDSDETVLRTISSCGCARIDLAPGTVVPAGGHIDIPIILKAWGAARRKAHDVRLILSGDRLGPLLRMDVEITSPLRTIPSAAQQALHPDGRVRVVGSSEATFQVLGVEPPLPVRIEPDLAHVGGVCDWDAGADWTESPEGRDHPAVARSEDGSWDRITLHVLTDHPECERLTLELYGPRHQSPVWLK